MRWRASWRGSLTGACGRWREGWAAPRIGAESGTKQGGPGTSETTRPGSVLNAALSLLHLYLKRARCLLGPAHDLILP